MLQVIKNTADRKYLIISGGFLHNNSQPCQNETLGSPAVSHVLYRNPLAPFMVVGNCFYVSVLFMLHEQHSKKASHCPLPKLHPGIPLKSWLASSVKYYVQFTQALFTMGTKRTVKAWMHY